MPLPLQPSKSLQQDAPVEQGFWLPKGDIGDHLEIPFYKIIVNVFLSAQWPSSVRF
jgi:hypothetical protein